MDAFALRRTSGWFPKWTPRAAGSGLRVALGLSLVGRAHRLGGVDGGRPAAEELQRLIRARARLGGVGGQRQPMVGGDVQAVEAQAELADDRGAGGVYGPGGGTARVGGPGG